MRRQRAWRSIVAVLGLVLAIGCEGGDGDDSGAVTSKHPVVVLATSQGDVTIELFPEEAPITVENFLSYVDGKFYDGTIFHRVVPGFVIQGGGFTAAMEKKEPGKPIKNEAANGLKNLRGTLSMARTSAVDSATSQFFISLKDNEALDHRDETPRGFGYAVFGKVSAGMDVVDAIAGTETTTRGVYRNVPAEPIGITTAKVAD
jgi:peptidyl-prolyl cis-trans isomerase A (cyclophilin A)